jgi:hypothetical protein
MEFIRKQIIFIKKIVLTIDIKVPEVSLTEILDMKLEMIP